MPPTGRCASTLCCSPLVACSSRANGGCWLYLVSTSYDSLYPRNAYVFCLLSFNFGVFISLAHWLLFVVLDVARFLALSDVAERPLRMYVEHSCILPQSFIIIWQRHRWWWSCWVCCCYLNRLRFFLERTCELGRRLSKVCVPCIVPSFKSPLSPCNDISIIVLKCCCARVTVQCEIIATASNLAHAEEARRLVLQNVAKQLGNRRLELAPT